MPARLTFKEGEVEAHGLTVRYLEAGQGEAVVAVDSLTWVMPKLYEAMAERYRVVVMEAPALGAGSPVRPPKDLARITAQATASLIVGTYTLIGASVSANVALWQALQTPDNLDALVLISPNAILPTGDAAPAGGNRPAEALLAHPEDAAGLPRPTSPDREQDLMQMLRSVAHDSEAEGRLAEIQCATLAVFGTEDRMVSPEAARIYRAKIPNCNISLVYDAGHLIEAERADSLIDLVSDFVERRETFIVGRKSTVVNP